MKTLRLLPLLMLYIGACNNPSNQENHATISDSNEIRSNENSKIDLTGSYNYEREGDTVSMHLNLQGDSAVGHLVYALKEKDSNFGNFKGIIQDGILIANYEFESEGKLSSREIAFKFEGNSAKEGYGEVLQTNSGFKFEDVSKLKFGEGIVLSKVEN